MIYSRGAYEAGSCLRQAKLLQRLPKGSRATRSNRLLASRQSSTYGASCRSGVILGAHVREAVANGVPVVALESTVITHGLPEPENARLAVELEEEICSGAWWDSAGGCESGERPQVVAATVGILRGQPIVGLSREQLEHLAHLHESRPIKCSRRDLPMARALGLNAGTTVSGTMAVLREAQSLVANHSSGARSLSCLRVFATGGLGGVHLGGELSMDVSADLYELARADYGLAVVSSGFKSFLDTRRSLELLESLGVTVASLGQTHGLYVARGEPGGAPAGQLDEARRADWRRAEPFPGFFTACNKEQARSPWRLAGVREAAQVLAACLGAGFQQQQQHQQQQQPQQQRCLLLATPIPAEFSLDAGGASSSEQAEQAGGSYAAALDKLGQTIEARPDLSGFEKTPLILEQLNRLTGGKTLRANLALLRNNARVAAHLAHELSLLHELGSSDKTALRASSLAPGE